MVERKEYLDQLIGWKEEPVIKVVTGIRRCGKTTLLMQYQAWLRENGVPDAQIVSVNFEELEYEELLDYKKLYAYLKERLAAGKTTCIFLDEIQKVPDFEKVVDSLYVKPDVDIYIILRRNCIFRSFHQFLHCGRHSVCAAMLLTPTAFPRRLPSQIRSLCS